MPQFTHTGKDLALGCAWVLGSGLGALVLQSHTVNAPSTITEALRAVEEARQQQLTETLSLEAVAALPWSAINLWTPILTTTFF